MTLTQVKTLINNSLTTAGKEVGGFEDMSWVDIGTAIGDLTADQFKTYLEDFALGVIKSEFDTRVWKKTLDITTDYQTYQGIKQYVKSGFLNTEDVSIVALVNGQDYNDRKYKKTPMDKILVTEDIGFQVSWSVPQQEAKMLFSSEEGAMGYVSQIEASVANTYNRAKWNLQLSLLNKLAISAYTDSRALNLVTLYNATHTAQVTDTKCMESSDFKNWCKESIANVKSYMSDISKKYNDGQLLTFTPEENIKCTLLTSFSNSLKNITTYNGIGEGALSLGDYKTVNAWQDNGSSALLPPVSTTGTIVDRSNPDNVVTASNVVGIIYDDYCLGMTIKAEKVTSDYVPKGDFTNFFSNFVGQEFLNTRNNAIVLTLN